MTQALAAMARMTLRQLRQVASGLGVSLYSRKSKDELLAAINDRQDEYPPSLEAIEAELPPAPRPGFCGCLGLSGGVLCAGGLGVVFLCVVVV